MAWEVMVSCYFVLILFSLFSFSNFLNFLFHLIASRVSGRANDKKNGLLTDGLGGDGIMLFCFNFVFTFFFFKFS